MAIKCGECGATLAKVGDPCGSSACPSVLDAQRHAAAKALEAEQVKAEGRATSDAVAAQAEAAATLEELRAIDAEVARG